MLGKLPLVANFYGSITKVILLVLIGISSILIACQPLTEKQDEDNYPSPTLPDTFAYQHLLPVGMKLQLANSPIDTMTGDSVQLGNLSFFLGYSDAHNDSTARRLLLNFNGTQYLTFAELPQVIDSIKQQTEYQEYWKHKINLWIDAEVPYCTLDYLQLRLRAQNLLSISYPLASGLQLATRLPPFSANECMSMSSRPCLRKKLLSADAKSFLDANGLDADWAPTYRYEPFVLKEENVFTLLVNPQREILKNTSPIMLDSITPQAQRFLETAVVPATKIFELKVQEKAASATYLSAFGSLKQVYTQVWNNASKEQYSLPYNQLERKDQISVRTRYPLVISIEQL